MKKIENTLTYCRLRLSRSINIFWMEVFKALHLRGMAIEYAKLARDDKQYMRKLRKLFYEH